MIRTQPAPFNSTSKSIENIFQITQYKSVAGQTLHLFSVKLSLRLSPVRDIIFHHHHLHYHSLQLMFLLGLHFSPSIIIADTSDPVLFVTVSWSTRLPLRCWVCSAGPIRGFESWHASLLPLTKRRVLRAMRKALRIESFSKACTESDRCRNFRSEQHRCLSFKVKEGQRSALRVTW